LRRHLDHLAAGLDIDADEFQRFQGPEAVIAAQIRDFFPLPMLARAANRRQWLEKMGTVLAGWSAAVGRLLDQAPRIASLDNVLLEQIVEVAEAEKRARQPRTVTRSYAKATGGDRRSYVTVYILVFLGIALLRGLFGSSSNSPTRPSYESEPARSVSPVLRYDQMTPDQKAAYDSLNGKRRVNVPPGIKDSLWPRKDGVEPREPMGPQPPKSPPQRGSP
jgi:hypothetical protein